MDADIIIVGSGASGLMAAKILAEKKYKILLLEARDRCGGRIFTYQENDFPETIELGAEFIHGDLPVTMQLCSDAGLSYTEAGGRMYHMENGKIAKGDFSIPQWHEFKKKLEELSVDIPIAEFLNKYFSDSEFSDLRLAVKNFAEGYDAADTVFASTFALRDEWLHQEDNNYRIDGGYILLIEYLRKALTKNNGEIILSSPVKEIKWEKNKVTAITANAGSYTAKKIIITIPVSLVKQNAISFTPQIEEKITAAAELGFGDVIKIVIAFREKFWEHAGMHGLGFLFTDQKIPTWWAQNPGQSYTLTGWLAGPRAKAVENATDDEISQIAITSLAQAFQFTMQKMEDLITGIKIVNWSGDSFTKGAYAYNTVNASAAIRILSEPVEETIYFAGESIYNGSSMGTVEAALTSGKLVAEKITK